MARESTPPGLDPVIEAYKKHVDRTLLREGLRKSWDERAQALIALLRAAEEFQRAGERLRDHSAGTRRPA